MPNSEDFYGVWKFVAENGGVENFRCFAQLSIVETIIPSLGISVVRDNERTWVECCIDESRYTIDEGYKITLRSLDPRACRKDFYQSDFTSLIKSGHIVIKNENQKIEHVEWIEPLCGSAYIKHEADIISGCSV